MHVLLALLVLCLCGCNELWNSFDAPHPDNCVGNVGICNAEVGFCNFTTLLCDPACSSDGFCKMNLFDDSRLQSVWGADENDVWAAGEKGKIIHWNGVKWSISQSPVNDSYIRALWGADSRNIWGVGNKNIIIKWDGSSWMTQMYGGSASDLLGIWGLNADNIWAVGAAGVNWKLEAGSWTQQPPCGNKDLAAIWGFDTNNILAVGEKQEVATEDYRNTCIWSGGNFSRISSGGSGQAHLSAIWGDPKIKNSIWAGGYSLASMKNVTRIYQWDGTSWGANVAPSIEESSIASIWGTDASNIWAVGGNGLILHWDGKAWTQRQSGTPKSLHGVWGPNADQLWVVGDNGTILHWRKS